MIINHNMNSMNAHRNSVLNTTAAGKSMEKLSSGLRINRAGDDAAGLAISEKMRGQIKGLSQSQRNAQDGISYIQTMEGALNEVSDMLTRAKELSVQAYSDTYTSSNRQKIIEELTDLQEEIEHIVSNTSFNGKTMDSDMNIVIDDNNNMLKIAGVSVGTIEFTVELTSTQASAIHAGTATIMYAVGDKTIGAGLTSGDKAKLPATGAITSANVDKYQGIVSVGKINNFIEKVSTERGKLGALQNRLEHTSNNLGTTVENLTAAESRIRDTDMAKEMSAFSAKNIITQASLSMLAQANQLPQNVLSILR